MKLNILKLSIDPSKDGELMLSADEFESELEALENSDNIRNLKLVYTVKRLLMSMTERLQEEAVPARTVNELTKAVCEMLEIDSTELVRRLRKSIELSIKKTQG